MNIYLTTEECPGCGLLFEASPELAQVDFNGRQFKKDNPEERE